MEKQTFDSVWDALEDTPEAAANMQVRAVQMTAVQDYARGLRVSQTEAADRLGITQPRLNDLLRGRIDKFSLDALVNILSRSGKRVDLEVRDVA